MASPQSEPQAIEFLRRVAAGTAHDLNNLLLLVIGCAELSLDDGTLTPATRKLMHDILAASARAAALTRQFLALGRPPVAPMTAVDITALLRSSDPLLRLLAGDRVRLYLDPGKAPLWVLSDDTQLEQVILNLALNARDAMPMGGTLSITAAAVAGPQPRARLTVTDTGSGIDPAIRERMYEPYVTTKRDASHYGLGLAVVRSIVDQLGGSIQVSSALGLGTTFLVDLPQAPHAGTSTAPPS